MSPLKHAIAVRISTRFKLIDRTKRRDLTGEEMLETVKTCLTDAAADEKFDHYGITHPYTAIDSSTVFFMDVGGDPFKHTVYCRISPSGSIALRTFTAQELPDTWKPATH